MTARTRPAGPERDAVELVVPTGLPAAVVVSQLIWRALGPTGGWARSVVDWAGLAGLPADRAAVVAGRHRISTTMLYLRIGKVRDLAARLTLPDSVHTGYARPSQAGEDHLGRYRQARLLGLPTPTLAAPEPVVLTAAQWGIATAARRTLAAAGPTPLPALTAAMRRHRRRTTRGHPTTRPDLTGGELRELLRGSGAGVVDRDDICYPTGTTPAPARYTRLLDLARSTDRSTHSNNQLVDLLHLAGYTGTMGPILAYHPLLIHLARGRWAILGVGTPTRLGPLGDTGDFPP